MNNKETDETQIVVLGGLGEVGKNMYCVMHKDAIVIIDAGVSFPESELLGVDYVLPDFTSSNIPSITSSNSSSLIFQYSSVSSLLYPGRLDVSTVFIIISISFLKVFISKILVLTYISINLKNLYSDLKL